MRKARKAVPTMAMKKTRLPALAGLAARSAALALAIAAIPAVGRAETANEAAALDSDAADLADADAGRLGAFDGSPSSPRTDGYRKRQWYAEAYDGAIREGILASSETSILLTGRGPGNRQVPRDIGRLCPRFHHLQDDQKILVWSRLLQAISFAESEYNTRDAYREPTGNVSVGLLQLSWSDESTHGCAFRVPIRSPRSPHRYIKGTYNAGPEDPLQNLQCGVRILAHQLERRGTVFEGLEDSSGDRSFYWSTLNRKGSPRFEVVRRKWLEMTGWDLLNRKAASEAKVRDGKLPFCYPAPAGATELRSSRGK